MNKSYRSGRREIPALRDVSLDVAEGEYLTIVGPSGCGKSTLLNLITGIDKADSGEVLILGTELSGLGQDGLARWRGREVGIVFQFFQLMPTLTARENILLPMDLAGNRAGSDQRARDLLTHVGLQKLGDHLPSELSGGEQQRVAVARALANGPRLLVADEPTGNLDTRNGEIVAELIESEWRQGTTVVVVTHDRNLAGRAPRTIEMLDGEIVNDIRAPLQMPTISRELVSADSD